MILGVGGAALIAPASGVGNAWILLVECLGRRGRSRRLELDVGAGSRSGNRETGNMSFISTKFDNKISITDFSCGFGPRFFGLGSRPKRAPSKYL
ncbi:MAG: hypothetical protein ACLPN5_10955 [Roseiarcus sp.]